VDQKPFGTSDFALNPEPRCPCLLLLDVSGSMEGAPIAELNAGLKSFRDDLVADDLASKRVEIACITFGDSVNVATEFETAAVFEPPWVRAAGNTPMGAAISSGIELARLRKEVYRQNGIAFYRPWIFLITDGAPTDSWTGAANGVRDGEAAKAFAFFAVGAYGKALQKQNGAPIRTVIPWKYGFKATLFVVTSAIGQKWDRVDCLGWEDLRRLRESGVFSIQSHSHDLHRKVKTSEGSLPIFVAAKYGLYEFPGAPSWGSGVYDDLRASRSLIEQRVGGEVNCLAWPYGFGDAALDSVAASAGYSTTLDRIARNMARSSRPIWEGPSSPMETPAWDPQNLRLGSEYWLMRIWSKAREKKAAKVERQGILPRVARPRPAPTMFCSAMYISKNFWG